MPSWVRISTAAHRARETFVPLSGSRLGPDGLSVAVDKDVVSRAPTVNAGDQLSPADATNLYTYDSAVRHGAP